MTCSASLHSQQHEHPVVITAVNRFNPSELGECALSRSCYSNDNEDKQLLNKFSYTASDTTATLIRCMPA